MIVKTGLRTFLFTMAALLLLGGAARAVQYKYLQDPLEAQYPPFDADFSEYHNAWPAMADRVPPTVPAPGQWPYVTSWPYIQGWSHPNWWPYSSKWDYYDRYPYYEWWTYSDWLAYEDRWKYGASPAFSDHWSFPANWPHPNRWSPIDQWSDFTRWPSTADIGAIDMVNERHEAIAYGDYTFLLDVGDKVYITRTHRMLGVARVVKLTDSYVMLQTVQATSDYFLEQGDTFQLVALPPATKEYTAPRVNLMLDDGRFVSYNDFVPRDYWRGDFFTVRRNGQNVGSARLLHVGYGYAMFEPAEGAVPQVGDVLMHRESPQELLSIISPRQLPGSAQVGVSFKKEESSLIVEETAGIEQKRGELKKLKKHKDWPDTDIWWEDTYPED